MSKEENQLLRQCHRLVELAGGYAHRLNNTAVFDPKTQKFRKFSRYAIKGMPDMLAYFPNGDMWNVEFKSPDGKLSPDQKLVQGWMDRLGHRYFVVDHVNQFIGILRKEKKMDIE